jgi:ubiquinone/menaquinone biosynthesis C-methylase UbiE
MKTDKYLLDNKDAHAGVRFRALSEIFDPGTFRHTKRVGIKEGWHCWEVGAGGTSVVNWLAEQVGTTGYVLATDIDVSWAKAASATNVEILQHDITQDTPPTVFRPFDLIHARLVLIHLSKREEALLVMRRALRPGGWLIIEDADPALLPTACLDVHGPEQVLANKIRAGFRALLSEHAVDLEFGRKLPRLLRQAGLVDVTADAYFPITSPASAILEKATIEQVGDKLIEAGYASAKEIEQHLKNVEAGLLDLTMAPMISASGHCPQNP